MAPPLHGAVTALHEAAPALREGTPPLREAMTPLPQGMPPLRGVARPLRGIVGPVPQVVTPLHGILALTAHDIQRAMGDERGPQSLDRVPNLRSRTERPGRDQADEGNSERVVAVQRRLDDLPFGRVLEAV